MQYMHLHYHVKSQQYMIRFLHFSLFEPYFQLILDWTHILFVLVVISYIETGT